MIDKAIFKPFIQAIQETVFSYLKETPVYSEPGLISASIKTEKDYFFDISSIIALSGEKILGSCIISFFNNDAEAMTRLILGQDEVIAQEIYDTLIELVNVIGGNLKRNFDSVHFDYTTPYIVTGSDKPVMLTPGFECYSIHFTVRDINFFVKLSFFDDGQLNGASVLKKTDDKIQKRTILIVDDSALARKTIMKELGDEYNYLEAGNGEEALDLAKKFLPDLITMDIEMPGLNGFYVCLSLRENPVTHDIPLVIITARQSNLDQEKGFYVGAIEFFSKPLIENELKDFIEDLFSQKKEKKGTVLLIENSHIERYNARYILKRFGYEVLEARDGIEAEKYFDRKDIDCIVTEISDNVQAAVDNIKRFKSHPVFRYIPIIGCTAHIGRRILKKVFDAGAVDFIRKPFIVEEYLARVKANVIIKSSFEEINVKNRELESVIKTRDKYFSFIVHEMRTPINSVLSFSKLKKDHLIPEEEFENIDRVVNDELFNVMELINSILEISKIENENIQLDMEEFPVNEIIEDTLKVLSALSKVKSLKLMLMLEENPVIYADRSKFKAIVVNLVSNAIKYTQQGFIQLSYRKENNFHVFILEDTGIGIPKGYETKIFKEYQRVTDKTDIRGTGIGLALVKKYVTAHGGEVTAESEGHDKGSRFIFTLPEKA